MAKKAAATTKRGPTQAQQVIKLLSKRKNGFTAQELAEKVGTTVGTIRVVLSGMRKSGLVTVTKKGVVAYYVTPENAPTGAEAAAAAA